MAVFVLVLRVLVGTVDLGASAEIFGRPIDGAAGSIVTLVIFGFGCGISVGIGGLMPFIDCAVLPLPQVMNARSNDIFSALPSVWFSAPCVRSVRSDLSLIFYQNRLAFYPAWLVVTFWF